MEGGGGGRDRSRLKIEVGWVDWRLGGCFGARIMWHDAFTGLGGFEDFAAAAADSFSAFIDGSSALSSARRRAPFRPYD